MKQSRFVVIALAVAALVLVGTSSYAADQKPVIQGTVITETAVIQAIDAGARLVTLKGEDGTTETIYAGPEVKRFDALKVGDKVTFTYYESMVYQIQQPGTPAPVPEAGGIVRRESSKPGGTVSKQLTAVVTVKTIDLAIPSITITTAEGNVMSFKVEDKKNLTGVKVGDKVQITYTQALAIGVEAAKK